MISSNTKLKKRQNKFTKYLLTLAAATSLFFGHQKSLAQDNDYKPSYTSTKITSSDIPKMTFNDYINMRESRANDSNVYRIFGLGVGASELPQQYRQGYFNQVVPLTTGNKVFDYTLATLDTLKIPVTQLNLNLQNATGKKIEYLADSWHAPVLVNAIRMGQIPAERLSKIVLLDPPGVGDYSDIKKLGIKVEVYAAEKNWFKALPETFIEQNKSIRGEPLPGITPGAKWTKEFGGGLPGLPQPKGIGSTVRQIPTNHYTKSILGNLSQQGILKPLPIQNNFNSPFPKHSLTTGSNFGQLSLSSHNLERTLTTPTTFQSRLGSIDSIITKPLVIAPVQPIQYGNINTGIGNRGIFQGGYMKPTQIYTQPIMQPTQIYTQPKINYTPTRIERYTPPPRIETYRPPRR